MNRLIHIGWLGIQSCYLNVDRAEAIKRFIADGNPEPQDSEIDEFEFDDEFGAYDVWKK